MINLEHTGDIELDGSLNITGGTITINGNPIGGGDEWTGGTNYILVKAEGTDTENAVELQSAYNLAVSASTAMSASSDNRITIIAAPGNYNFDSNFVMDEEFIDLVSLDGNRSIIFNGLGSIGIPANDVLVRGVDVGTKSFLGGDSSLSKIENCRGGEQSFTFNDDASGTFVNCEGGDRSFGGSFITSLGSASGTFTNCIGGDESFGGYDTLSGTFTNCIGGDESFGRAGVTITSGATFTNCEGGNFSFGSGTGGPFGISGGTLSGTFTDCVGGGVSFGGSISSGGTITSDATFTNCKGGGYSFGSGVVIGGEASGTFKDCEGGDDSFGGGLSGTSSGTFTNCVGGDNSFASSGGTASGIFTNCVGGDSSFGVGGTLTGKLYYCRLTSGLFQTPTGSGVIIGGIDGNDDVVNS